MKTDRQRMWFSSQTAGESRCADHKTDIITERLPHCPLKQKHIMPTQDKPHPYQGSQTDLSVPSLSNAC